MHHDVTADHDTTPHRVRLGFSILVSISVGMTVGNLNSNLMPLLLPGYAARFSLSDSEAGLVATTQLLATAIAALTLRLAGPGEACSDSDGRRTCMVEIRVDALSGKRNRRRQ